VSAAHERPGSPRASATSSVFRAADFAAFLIDERVSPISKEPSLADRDLIEFPAVHGFDRIAPQASTRPTTTSAICHQPRSEHHGFRGALPDGDLDTGKTYTSRCKPRDPRSRILPLSATPSRPALPCTTVFSGMTPMPGTSPRMREIPRAGRDQEGSRRGLGGCSPDAPPYGGASLEYELPAAPRPQVLNA
jgi:hypothetical protein